VRVDRLLENELFVRVLAAALAILVYVQVVSQPGGGTVQRTFPGVPVQMAGVPPDLAVDTILPRTVAVTVRGDAQVIQGLSASDMEAYVDLQAARLGRQAYYVTVATPRGVELIAANPATVIAITEPVVDREFPVQVETNGVVASGFALGAPTVSPPSVVVHGPQSVVDTVARLVITVQVDGARADVGGPMVPVPLDAGGQPVHGVQLVPAQVSVTVPVARQLPVKPVPVRPVLTGAPASGYALGKPVVVPATVAALGPNSVLAGLRALRTAPISVSGATSEVRATVMVLEPAGVLALTPEDVTVSVPVVRRS
jgi:YbbR domain-containing protein